MSRVKIWRDGAVVEVDEASLERVHVEPAGPSYRDLRAIAYRDELGKEPGDFVKTIGDVLDVLIAEVDAIRSARAETAAFAELLPKVAAIKARHPKP